VHSSSTHVSVPLKSTGTAYLWWLFLGGFGVHKFYLGRPGWGIVYALTLGLLGMGLLYDLFTMPSQVRAANADMVGSARELYGSNEERTYSRVQPEQEHTANSQLGKNIATVGGAALAFVVGYALIVAPDTETSPIVKTEPLDQSTGQQKGTAQAAQSTLAQSLTGPQNNAVRSANSYLSLKGFSRDGLIGQLSSPYGDGYSVADATAAVNSLSVDWNEHAARSAQQYLSMKGFSCNGLIEQLSSDFGDKYTNSQASYGAGQAGAC
jgi:TM2 domain-containing membrane protein YozV